MPPTTAPRIPIVVLAGQSNANSTQLVMDAYRHVAQSGGMLVHLAANGSALSDRVVTGGGNWNAGTATTPMGNNLATLFNQLWSILDPASPSHVPGAYLDSMIWVQGEADAFSTVAASQYGANLRAMHDALTARFGAHDLVLSGLSDAPHQNRSFSGSHAANWDLIQAQQQSLAAERTSVHLVNPDQVAARAGLSADDMFRWDYIHYDDSRGFAGLLGRSLATAALPPGPGPASLAGPPTTVPVFAGTFGDDSFTVTLSGFRQVMAGSGHDKVTVSTQGASVSLIETSAASTRIIETTATGRRIIDLVAVEEVTLGWGHDTVRLAGGVTVVNTGSGYDQATGFALNETFNMGRGNDYAYGARGNDTLRGEDGHDRLWGAEGDDVVSGGNGNDTLWGGDGNDVLTGGYGNDLMAGDAGQDIFVFSGRSGADTITGFDADEDVLQFTGIRPGAVTIRDIGDDLLVTAGTTQVRLVGVSEADVHHGDILFL
jgi:Ca2+-binding RTX toxin-like protein